MDDVAFIIIIRHRIAAGVGHYENVNANSHDKQPMQRQTQAANYRAYVSTAAVHIAIASTLRMEKAFRVSTLTAHH